MIEVAYQSVLVELFYFVDGCCVFNEFVEGAYLFWSYLVWNDVLLPQNGVKVFDVLHGDDFVGQLIVVFIEERCELEVKD